MYLQLCFCAIIKKTMGATLRQRDIETEKPSQMDQLFDWISLMRRKKMKWLRNRRRDIRVEAVLAHALCHAERQLRDRQIARITRWQKMKEEMLLNEQNKIIKKDNCQNNQNDNNMEICTEIMSLDTFMSDLNKIKSPLQR